MCFLCAVLIQNVREIKTCIQVYEKKKKAGKNLTAVEFSDNETFVFTYLLNANADLLRIQTSSANSVHFTLQVPVCSYKGIKS